MAGQWLMGTRKWKREQDISNPAMVIEGAPSLGPASIHCRLVQASSRQLFHATATVVALEEWSSWHHRELLFRVEPLQLSTRNSGIGRRRLYISWGQPLESSENRVLND
jgi:hypothetical protein